MAVAEDCYDDWQLWLSPKLIDMCGDILQGKLGQQFKRHPYSSDDVAIWQQELRLTAEHSGGGIAPPQGRVFGVLGDEEDDKNVASLAMTVGAQVVVTQDKGIRQVGKRHLPALGGKTGMVLFVRGQKFVDHVHASRQP